MHHVEQRIKMDI
uniref:Uncharacterized protein n=1 Tax=Anguilla anguilla TaxID=7936 RepID=A0A0E9SGT9_ANGAN